MNVNELRDELIKRGLTPDEAKNIKGKRNLLDRLELLSGEITTDLEFATPDEISVSKVNQDKDSKDNPSYNDIKWHDYVMSKFLPDELKEGNPKVDGLRRVAENLLGDIVDSGPISTNTIFDADGNIYATCSFHVIFQPFIHNQRRVFSACADGYYKNISDSKYAKFPLAIAETRAEARALRRALKLKVVAAEELDDTNTDVYSDNKMVVDTQIAVINAMCDRLSIDINKITNDIKSLTYGQAVELITQLNKYQTSHEPIPDVLKKG